MNNNIYPCIWFNGNGPEAAQFYSECFPNSSVEIDNDLVQLLHLDNQIFMILNASSEFTPNSTISFMVMCDNEGELQSYWDKMLDGGKILMELNAYPWSKKYGWIQDKYNVSWQFYLDDKKQTPQKYTPTLMFTNDQNGKAEEAIRLYTSIFPNSNVQGMMKYTGENDDIKGNIAHAQFSIDDYVLMATDSSMNKENFNEGISLVVECKDQNEIDRYWNELTKNGGQESQCGWLKDGFGVSWQIIPAELKSLMSDANPEQSKAVMDELMKMKKIDLAVLKKAAQTN